MTATYLIADACLCLHPLEFVDGVCSKCGRWMDIDVRAEGSVDAWILLEAAIERTRLKLLDEAEADGIDVDGDPDGYKVWLEMKMYKLDQERKQYATL